MINVYERDETVFTHNGITVLSDTILCLITEELNGLYELELEYPLDERGKWRHLLGENIIKANGQLFRIYHRVKTLTSVKVHARHIFYDLADNILEDVRPTSMGGAAALAWILDRTQYAHPFTSIGDVAGVDTKYFIRKNPVEAIMGDEGIISVWGGELIRDNFLIKLMGERGLDRGVLVSYGKNIQGIEEDLDTSGLCTRLMPVGKEGILLVEKYIDSPYIANYSYPKIKVVEFPDAEDVTTLGVMAQDYMDNGEIDIPQFNYKIDFLELSKTEEYKNYAVLERVFLADTVTIRHSKLGLDLKAKVIKTVYNDLTKRLEKVELGSFKANFATSVNDSVKYIKKEIIQVKSDYQVAIEEATRLITGASGGNVVIRQDASGKPIEILIMDTEDVLTAMKVWRWNIAGFGYSKTGINGPFEVAITMDGHIVASFITALTISGNQIITGTITSSDGKVAIGIDSGTGISILGGALTVTNNNNTVIVDGLHNMFKIVAQNTVAIARLTTDTEKTYTYAHGLGYKPAFTAFQQDPYTGGYTHLPAMSIGRDGGLVNFSAIIRMRADENNVYIDWKTNDGDGATDANVTYFLYKEVAF